MKVSDFSFILPPELIAQDPPAERGTSRLLVLDRVSGAIVHAQVRDLPRWLRAGDVLVLNDTKVFPARLLGTREPGGGAVECLLVSQVDDSHWEALVHPGQRLKPGRRMRFERAGHVLLGEVLERRFFGRRLVRLWSEEPWPVVEVIDAIGHVPLPPYIRRPDRDSDRERYQTVFARQRGSVAAPTAGLHFTDALLREMTAAGVEVIRITLHVGYGTFKPVRVADVEAHTVDPERWSVDARAAASLNAALGGGRRIVAVGTTTTRALETAAALGNGSIAEGTGESGLFIYPGHRFRAIGGLLTNFHLPESSLLMLVSAFGGRERVLAAYAEAVRGRYRFYSYGDAMFIA